MKIKTAMITAALLAVPVLAIAADSDKGTMMTTPSAESQNMPCGMGMQGGPMMRGGPCEGRMGQGMGMDPANMDMMERQQMMERRMDMMEMMMERRQRMQGGRGGHMMGGPRGDMMPGMMGQGMGMQGGPMMNNRMNDMRGMSMEQQQQMMQQRIDMMQQVIDTMQKRRDMMQQRMDMMSKQNQQPGKP